MSKFVGFGCDGASNMMGCKTGLVTRLQECYPEVEEIANDRKVEIESEILKNFLKKKRVGLVKLLLAGSNVRQEFFLSATLSPLLSTPLLSLFSSLSLSLPPYYRVREMCQSCQT